MTDNTVPRLLASWIKERGFDVCDWLPVPANKVRKIPGKDAYRFGQLVLVRLSLPKASETNGASQSQ
jgi:hypothetical protein